ncbi:MAG: hypothetical protein LBU08_02330 [Tannerellaceae bacterium]|jgi:hypothetical protein|nr:hypothetical protein [Tannerellaceae bacterium]
MKTSRFFFHVVALACPLLLLPLLLGAASWFVKPLSSGSANGRSWDDAASLEAALAGLTGMLPGDTLLLHTGLYSISNTYELERSLTLIGGANNTPGLPQDSTVLTGLNQTRIFYIAKKATASTIRLQDMILKNGNATAATKQPAYGGAIYNQGGVLSLSNVSIHSCVATNGWNVSGYGGAIFSIGGIVSLLGNTRIHSNIASANGSGYGGAVAVQNNEAIYFRDNVEVSYNRASTASGDGQARGGAFYLNSDVTSCTLHLFRAHIHDNYALDKSGSVILPEAGAIYCQGDESRIVFDNGGPNDSFFNFFLIYNNKASKQNVLVTGEDAIFPSNTTHTVSLSKEFQRPVGAYGPATVRLLDNLTSGTYEVQNGKTFHVNLSIDPPYQYISPCFKDFTSEEVGQKNFLLKITPTKNISLIDSLSFRYCVLNLPKPISGKWLHKGVAYSPAEHFLATPGIHFRDPLALDKDTIRLVSFPPVHPALTPALSFKFGNTSQELPFKKARTTNDSTLWHFPLTTLKDTLIKYSNKLPDSTVSFQSAQYNPSLTAVLVFDTIRIQGLFYLKDGQKVRIQDTLLIDAATTQTHSFSLQSDYQWSNKPTVSLKWNNLPFSTLNPERAGDYSFSYDVPINQPGIYLLNPNPDPSQTIKVNLTAFDLVTPIDSPSVASYYNITDQLTAKSYNGYYLGLNSLEAHYDASLGVFKKYPDSASLSLNYPVAIPSSFVDTFAIRVEEPAAHIPFSFNSSDRNVFTSMDTVDVIGDDGRRQAVLYYFSFRPSALSSTASYRFVPRFSYDLIFLPELPSHFSYKKNLVANELYCLPLNEQSRYDTITIYPVADEVTGVAQTYTPLASATLQHSLQNGGYYTELSPFPVSYLKDKGVFQIRIPAQGYPNRGTNPPLESPKQLTDIKNNPTTYSILRSVSVGTLYSFFSYTQPSFFTSSGGTTFSFKGLLIQPFRIKSSKPYCFPVAIQDNNRPIPLLKQLGDEFFFDPIVAYDHDAALSILALDFSELLTQYSQQLTFSGFSFDNRLNTYFVTLTLNPGYEKMFPKEVDNQYYSTTVLRQGTSHRYDIHFSFKPFSDEVPLRILPDIVFDSHTINLAIDPKFSPADAFAFFHADGLIHDTTQFGFGSFSCRFAVRAQGENRFLTPQVLVADADNRTYLLHADSSITLQSPKPGTQQDLERVFYYSLTVSASVDVTVSASPATYVSLSSVFPREYAFLLPSVLNDGFYVDSLALKKPEFVNVYIRCDSRIPSPALFFSFLRGIRKDLPDLHPSDTEKAWQFTLHSDDPNIVAALPPEISPSLPPQDAICLIYPNLPPEVHYVKNNSSPNLVIDQEKPGPLFLLKFEGSGDNPTIDTFSLFLRKPYHHLTPAVSIEAIPGEAPLYATDAVKHIRTASAQLNENAPGLLFQYAVAIHEHAILRISLPPYYSVSLPKSLPQGVSYLDSDTRYYFHPGAQDCFLSLLVQQQYRNFGIVVNLSDGSAGGISLLHRKPGAGSAEDTLIYHIPVPNHDLSLLISSQYHSLTLPAQLPPSLEYVAGYIGSGGNNTYFYPHDAPALDTLCLFVKGEAPSISFLPNNAATSFLYPPIVQPAIGGALYRYPIRFTGQQTLCIFPATGLHDTIILPDLTASPALEYLLPTAAGQHYADPGTLFSFSIRTKEHYADVAPFVSLNGSTLLPVSFNPLTTSYTYTFSIPGTTSAARKPIKLMPQIQAHYFTVDLPAALPLGITYHYSSNLRHSPDNHFYRALGYDFRDTLVLSVDPPYTVAPPKVSLLLGDNPNTPATTLLPHNTRKETASSSVLYTYIISLPYDTLSASVSVDFSPRTYIWPALPVGVNYESLPTGLTEKNPTGLTYYYQGQQISFTLKTKSPYMDVAPLVHHNGQFVERTYLGSGKYRYSFVVEDKDNSSISFFLPYRTITLPTLPEGLSYVGLPAAGEHFVSPNSDLPFLFTLLVDQLKTGFFTPYVLINGTELNPLAVNGSSFTYSLKTPLNLQPFISLASRTLSLTLPPLPEGLAYADGVVPGESLHKEFIDTRFTILVSPDYQAVKPLVIVNGTTLPPSFSAPDGSAHTYVLDKLDVNTVIAVNFSPITITLPANLPAGVSYVPGSLAAGSYFRTLGDPFTFSLRTIDADQEAPIVSHNGTTVLAKRSAPGLFEYEFTISGSATALISYKNLAFLISIDSPQLSIVEGKPQGIHYLPLTGIHETLVLQVDPDYAGLTPILSVNDVTQAPLYVQGNRFSYLINGSANIELHAFLRYNTFVLEQLAPRYLNLLPAAGTYYRDAGVPFSFRLEDYLALGEPRVFFSDQTLAPLSQVDNLYSYSLNPGQGAAVYLIRVASILSDALRLPGNHIPAVAYHDASLHLYNLAGRPLTLTDAAGKILSQLLPRSEDDVLTLPLPTGIYCLFAPSYQGEPPLNFKFLVR